MLREYCPCYRSAIVGYLDGHCLSKSYCGFWSTYRVNLLSSGINATVYSKVNLSDSIFFLLVFFIIAIFLLFYQIYFF